MTSYIIYDAFHCIIKKRQAAKTYVEYYRVIGA